MREGESARSTIPAHGDPPSKFGRLGFPCEDQAEFTVYIGRRF
jgi:hypothetical protein